MAKAVDRKSWILGAAIIVIILLAVFLNGEDTSVVDKDEDEAKGTDNAGINNSLPANSTPFVATSEEIEVMSCHDNDLQLTESTIKGETTVKDLRNYITIYADECSGSKVIEYGCLSGTAFSNSTNICSEGKTCFEGSCK